MSLDEQLRAVIDTAATPIGRNEIGATLAVPQARRRLMPVAAISIGIAAVVALVVTISVREDQVAPFNSSGPTATRPFVPPTTTAPPPIVPPLLVSPEGDEYPIERITAPEVGLGTLVTPLVVDQRSFRFWKTADATLFTVRTLTVESDRVSDGRCAGTVDLRVVTAGEDPVVNGWGYGCGPAWVESVMPLVGGGWDQPDGGVGHGTWRWCNVPPDTDFVQYRSGELVLWQRPVDGMASFPSTSEYPTRGTTATAYRADGAVLGTADDASMAAGSDVAKAAAPGWMDGSQLPDDLVQDGTHEAFTAFTGCLSSAGAIVSSIETGGTVDLPDGPAGDGVWLGCIGPAQVALDAFVAAHVDDVQSDHTDLVEVADTEAPATTEAPTVDATVPPCLAPTYTIQPGDSGAGIAQRYGVTYADLLAADPTVQVLDVGAVITMPCGVHTTGQSTDRSGLDAFVQLAATDTSVAQSDVTVTNTIVAASDTEVWVITGGATSTSEGGFRIHTYDRSTLALISAGEGSVTSCVGPIEMIDDPSAPIEALPFVCSADGVRHTFDAFNSHANPS